MNTMLPWPLLVGILAGCFDATLASTYAQNFGDGFERSTLKEKYSELLPRAEGGEAYAQWKLGIYYQSFKSAGIALGYWDGKKHVSLEDSPPVIQLRKDEAEAVKWFRKAAEQNHGYGQLDLADCLRSGKGGKRDVREAVEWYRKAAENGLPEAEWHLAEILHRGNGIEKNATEAAKWYRKAADRNNPRAQQSLGQLYQLGEGVQQDHVEAAKWFRKAAILNNAVSQLSLGACYETGTGVKQDVVEAYAWRSVALKEAPDSFLPFFVSSLSLLSPQQIADGQNRASELTAKIAFGPKPDWRFPGGRISPQPATAFSFGGSIPKPILGRTKPPWRLWP